jgi:RNA 3'-terminal phosphate cyclase (ATP)
VLPAQWIRDERGQILRTALALSMCTGQAIAIQRIRAKRPKPGLICLAVGEVTASPVCCI